MQPYDLTCINDERISDEGGWVGRRGSFLDLGLVGGRQGGEVVASGGSRMV